MSGGYLFAGSSGENHVQVLQFWLGRAQVTPLWLDDCCHRDIHDRVGIDPHFGWRGIG
jgi:hypothetical protein